MIDALIRFALRRRAVVLALAVLLLAVGTWTALKMPVDVFPDLTAPTVTVITEAHGMAPTEVENQVTFPIEAALNGAPNVRRIRSATAVGISVVWVEFEWGAEIYSARQVVSEKLALASSSLPPEVERPVLAPVSSIMGEILFIALTSDRHKPLELRSYADTVVRRRLLSIPGVSQVTPIGGGEKQYQVVLSPEKLRDFGVSIEQVARVLETTNENVSAGVAVEGGIEYLVSGEGRVRTLDDLANAVVAERRGVPVLIRQLGTVRLGEALKRGEASANTKPAVVLGIQKQPGANTLALTGELERILDELEKNLPAGMKLDKRMFRQADFIEVSIRNVLHALRDGGLLVILIVLIFLANGRATLITLTALPLSVLAAVLALKGFGATVNTMTLGGLAIAIGELVDDAVIDVENVYRRLRENGALPVEKRRNALDVVYTASTEIRSSVVFATIIVVLVFLPLFFLSGVEGRLLRPLGIAYVVSLAASLVVALTVTPALCLWLLPGSKSVQRGTEPRLVTFLKRIYGWVLGPTLRHPWLVTAPVVLAFAAAIYSTRYIGQAFLPEFNEGTLTLAAVTLPGTSLDQSDRLGRILEQSLLKFPEVVSVARRTGRAELDEHAQGVEAAELDVDLKMKDRSKAQFLEALRKDLSLIPGLNVTIGQPISHRIDHMLSGTRANVAVKIFGDDLYALRTLGERARKTMAEIRGVVDLSVEQQLEIPILRVKYDRPKLARHGIPIRDATRALEAGFQGVRVSSVLEGRNSYDLVLRVADERGWTTATVPDLPLDAPGGAKIPLKAVAAIKKDMGPNMVTREKLERKIVVTCNVAERDVVSVVEDVRRAVDPLIAPLAEKGYHVEYGGQFESAIEASRLLAFLGVGVVFGIALLLYVAFGSVRDAALVMLNLPLALIGGVVGVFISGGVLSVASLIGFITVFGIATRNGIMLVSHIRHLQLEEGVTDLGEAVRKGALERLAPILMTALAAGLALIPLALGGGKPGNEIQTPMAIVILLGLLSSMVLNMFVVPALYLRFGRPAAHVEGGVS